MLTPWKTVSPINTPTWVLERNPYYMGVDTQGNQLPYIDRISMTLAENLEVLNLRAIAGQYDLQERHTALAKLPVFLENRVKGGYDVRLDPALNGSDATLQTNQAYDADPEIAKWLHTRDFRRALSLGIDRDQLNETFWVGVGTPGSIAPAESAAVQPGTGVAARSGRPSTSSRPMRSSTSSGSTKKDAEGYRLRTDGKGRLRLELQTSAGAFVPHTQIAEMIKEQWKKIGIQADVKEIERSLFFTRVASNEHQIAIWANDGSEVLYLFPRHALPARPGAGGARHAHRPLVREQRRSRARRRRTRSCSRRSSCSARRAARRRRSATRSPRRSGRSWWTSSTASARWGCRRRPWACAS